MLGYIFQNGFLKVQLWETHRPWGYNGQNEKRAKHSPNHGLGNLQGVLGWYHPLLWLKIDQASSTRV